MRDAITLDILFSAPIVGFAIPALWTLVQTGRRQTRIIIAALLISVSALLQLLFAALITIASLTVDHSLRFAAAGIPCCVGALLISYADKNAPSTWTGTLTSSIAGLAIWMFFLTIH